jgi:glycogen operon protein
VEQLRKRQIKNLFTINLLAMGVPMILMGDEIRRTQQGNNNAYCQDNEISWFDWTLLDKHADIHRFVQRLIRFRLRLPKLDAGQDLSLLEVLRRAHIQWHGVQLEKPDWSDNSRTVACTVQGGRERLHIMFNAYWEPLEFELPPLLGDGSTGWRRVIDTYLESPQDFCKLSEASNVDDSKYLVQARSVVLLTGRGPK